MPAMPWNQATSIRSYAINLGDIECVQLPDPLTCVWEPEAKQVWICARVAECVQQLMQALLVGIIAVDGALGVHVVAAGGLDV